MKHRPSLKMQLQSYDNQNPSRTQGIPQPQQPQRNELQSYYPADVSAQHVQPYVMAEEQQTWSHPEWQMSAHCTQQPAQHQLYPCQFVPASVGAYDHSVKKEMPLSVIVSSATHTTARPHQQMLSVCSENNGQALPSQYSNATLVTPTCQSQSTINWQMNWWMIPHATFIVWPVVVMYLYAMPVVNVTFEHYNITLQFICWCTVRYTHMHVRDILLIA